MFIPLKKLFEKITIKLNSKKNNQNAGDSSTQINGDNNTVYNSYNEEKIKEIVLKFFQENSIIFNGHAKNIVETKSRDFTDELTANIKKRNPEKLLRLHYPEIQLAIYNALHTYVINNNEHIKKLLMKILEERIFIEDENSFDKIRIDKALKSLGEISKEQLDIITLNYTAFEIYPEVKPKTLIELEELLYKAYTPFFDVTTSESYNYCHLESIGLFNNINGVSILYNCPLEGLKEDSQNKAKGKYLERGYRVNLLSRFIEKYPEVFKEQKEVFQYLDEIIIFPKFSKIFELICDTEIQYFRLSPVGRYIAHHYLFEEIIGMDQNRHTH